MMLIKAVFLTQQHLTRYQVRDRLTQLDSSYYNTYNVGNPCQERSFTAMCLRTFPQQFVKFYMIYVFR
ncbi:MAG: hypothetical protein ICV54_15970 [Nostoc sp. C3-bin3]|nr:hypothetical protein [Nostoc sp. C3-bin3]